MGPAQVSDSVLMNVGATILLLAGVIMIGLVATGGRVVPLARRRPLGAAPTRSIAALAAAASGVANRALSGEQADRLGNALDLAGIRWRPQDFLVVVASEMVALFALGLLIWGPLVGVLLLLAGPLVALVVLRTLTGRRRRSFELQLEETLSILSGSLRAGYSLPQAASTVAAESESPTSEEFARVINEARVGRPFVQALEEAATRVKSDDFAWIVQAIAINREVGGNLADVLEGVGNTIRERTHLRRQVDALSAEGRLSAVILGALPFVVFAAISVMNPGYISKFGQTPIGIVLLSVAGVLLLFGLLWLRSVVKIRY